MGGGGGGGRGGAGGRPKGKFSKVFLSYLIFLDIQSNLYSPNTDGSFTMANSNSFLSPYEILPIAQEKQNLRKFSYFILELYVVCTH